MNERPAAVPFSDAEERDVRASVTDTADRHVHDDEYVSWKARDIRRLLATLDAARLSRDRGADALDRERLERDFASAFIRIRGAHNPDPGEPCAWCRLAAEQAAEAVVTSESLRAARSVPAPTLPALDVDRLLRAADGVTAGFDSPEAYFAAIAERYAAPTEEERQHE